MEFVVLALKNLNRYKLRSFLTTLGIVFGIGAVISMMSVGAGARSEILAQLDRLGPKNIVINTVRPPEEKKAGSKERNFINDYGLKFYDARYFKTILPTVEKVLSVHCPRKKVFYGNKILVPKILGVSPAYFTGMHLEIKQGRPLHDLDFPKARRVCVIGPGILRELAYIEDPLKLSLRIGDTNFRVVGVIKQADSTPAVGEALNIYIPFSTSLKRFGTLSYVRRTGAQESSKVELEQIIIVCRKLSQVIDTSAVVATILKKFHQRRDYEILVPLKQIQQAKKTQQTFSIVMVLIAGISLIVGGIGIANIMFASITERTREIGVRRALGARRRDIMLQFLSETIVIAMIGGILGCFLGIAGTYLIQYFTGWHAEIQMLSMFLTLAISCLVGILSGLVPAHHAAGLNPVTSLRHE